MILRCFFHRLVAIVFAILVFIGEASARTIYIYAGDGTCLECIEQTEASLAQELSDEYRITEIGASEVIGGAWREDAALFVVPGGRATPYARSLNGKGNAQLREYVEEGGAFLGLCAGGYYGGAFVEFAKGTDIEVIGSRELAFFPGKVIGPALAAFDYYSESGARLADINWRDPKSPHETAQSTLYYNGGGYFANVALHPEVQVLATYAGLHDRPPAIILAKVKKGTAILSGVHIEYHTDVLARLNKNLEATPIEYEKKRLRLLRNVLDHLRLNLSKTADDK
jgi:glutamine amidotransferase-like uncharacterized protein